MSNSHKQYLVEWDRDNKILKVILMGRGHDEAVMAELFQKADNIIEDNGRTGEIALLIDVSKLEKHIASRARKVSVEFLKSHPGIKKNAIVGASTPIKVVVNFVMAAAGKKNVMFFNTEAEALRWFHKD